MEVDTSDDEISIGDGEISFNEDDDSKRSVTTAFKDSEDENRDTAHKVGEVVHRTRSSDSGEVVSDRRLRKRRKPSIVEEESSSDEDISLLEILREVKLNKVPVRITGHKTCSVGHSSSSSGNPTNTPLNSDLATSSPGVHSAPSRPILDLPNELLQAILVRVPGRDVGQVSRVCGTFYRFYQEEWVWRDLCRNELGLEVSEADDAMQVYKHVHFHYGALQGYFMRCSVPGGGLLQVAFKGRCLVATDIQIDRFNKDSLGGNPIETEIFSIKLDKVSNFSKLSRQNKIAADCKFPSTGRSGHRCEISIRRFNKRKLDENSARTPQPGFSIQCHDQKHKDHTESHLKNWVNKSRVIHQGLLQNNQIGFTVHDLLNKLTISLAYGFSYVALKEQSMLPPVPEFDLRDTLIKHGLYVGDFMPHSGYQIVNMTYESFERLPYLLCRKVTSDGHVTTGLVALRAKMESIKVIDWNWKKKPSIQEVEKKDHVTYIELDDLKNRPPQKFLLPRNCKCAVKPPGVCQTVFRGEMMVNDGDPHWKWEWAEGFVVVFSEEQFGFLNLRSNYLHMFGRMKLYN